MFNSRWTGLFCQEGEKGRGGERERGRNGEGEKGRGGEMESVKEVKSEIPGILQQERHHTPMM
jgi:hypothetical protein